MRNLRNVLGAGLIALAGCSNEPASNQLIYEEMPLTEILGNPSKYRGMPVSLEGIPYSVAHGTDGTTSYPNLALVIGDGENSLLCYVRAESKGDRIVKAQALITSEINDGDDERMRVKGVMDENGILELNQIEANGYTQNFK